MAIPLAYAVGGVVLVALAGDGPFITTQAKVAYELHKHWTVRVPGREMAAVRLHSKDHFSGVCIYG